MLTRYQRPNALLSDQDLLVGDLLRLLLSEPWRVGIEARHLLFGRIDIPQPDGSFRTRLFGGKSVFDIEIVTEAAAREEAKRSYPVAVRPLVRLAC